jgi:hypothetical protein
MFGSIRFNVVYLYPKSKVMLVFELLGETIKVDIDKITRGIIEAEPQVHIGMGMFKAEPMDFTRKRILTKIKSYFTSEDCVIFEKRIENFTSDCMRQITVGILNFKKN